MSAEAQVASVRVVTRVVMTRRTMLATIPLGAGQYVFSHSVLGIAIQTTQEKHSGKRNLLTFWHLKLPDGRHRQEQHDEVGGDVGRAHALPES